MYRRTFQPNEDEQLLNVSLSVPWHRYDIKKLDQPQKLHQYIENISWDEAKLKRFINKRIEWEFNRVNRHFQHHDPWQLLFVSQIQNNNFSPPITEDSFNFILRHTLHRARDVQRFTRMCVEHLSNVKKIEKDIILMGRGNIKVDQQIIIDSLNQYSLDMTKEIITEGARRYELLPRLMQSLRGFNIPCSTDDFGKRISKICDFNTGASALWDACILGIFMTTSNQNNVNMIRTIVNKAGYRIYRSGSKKTIHAWSLFAYNWQGDFYAILDRFQKSDEVEAKLVLHPITHIYLLSRLRSECPIG